MELWEIILLERVILICTIKILRILVTVQKDNTCRVGHLFEIALLDFVAFRFDKSNVFVHEGE